MMEGKKQVSGIEALTFFVVGGGLGALTDALSPNSDTSLVIPFMYSTLPLIMSQAAISTAMAIDEKQYHFSLKDKVVLGAAVYTGSVAGYVLSQMLNNYL